MANVVSAHLAQIEDPAEVRRELTTADAALSSCAPSEALSRAIAPLCDRDPSLRVCAHTSP